MNSHVSYFGSKTVIIWYELNIYVIYIAERAFKKSYGYWYLSGMVFNHCNWKHIFNSDRFLLTIQFVSDYQEAGCTIAKLIYRLNLP